MEGSERFRAAVAAIDRANAGDPTTVEVAGRRGPKEVVHAELMTDWVRRLDPEADEVQLLAARAHHFRRWTTPRSAYPEGRAGYLRWRADARRRHAEEVGELLRAHGYHPDEVDEVAGIIRKEGLRSDRRVQVHEDALCLVFLQAQLDEVAAQLGEERTVDVLVRTLDKMSPEAVAAADRLELSVSARSLLERALVRRVGHGER